MAKAFISFLLLFTIHLLTIHSAFSQVYYCSEWKQQQSVTCVFAGERASVWARQCENPCHWRNYDHLCDVERLCMQEDPNLLTGECSEWKKESGITCSNRATGKWEQKWVRACQKGLVTTWCSNEDPNQH